MRARRMHLNMDLVYIKPITLFRDTSCHYPPLSLSLSLHSRVRALSLGCAYALGRASMHALVCRCLENVCRRAREKDCGERENAPAAEKLPAAQFVHSIPAVQAHTQTASVLLRYKTCAQLPEHSSEPMDTHIKRLSLHICMLCAIFNCILLHCLLHYIYTYRYHVDR